MYKSILIDWLPSLDPLGASLWRCRRSPDDAFRLHVDNNFLLAFSFTIANSIWTFKSCVEPWCLTPWAVLGIIFRLNSINVLFPSFRITTPQLVVRFSIYLFFSLKFAMLQNKTNKQNQTLYIRTSWTTLKSGWSHLRGGALVYAMHFKLLNNKT